MTRPGGVVVGAKLNCEGGPSSGATLEYEWLRNANPIPSATASTYSTTSADEGTLIQCLVKATSGSGTTFATSATRPVEPYVGRNLPESEGQGFISPTNGNTVEFGQLLTCSPPFGIHGSPAIAYQWLRDGVELPGANSNTYMPVEADVGTSFQCVATATTAEGKSLSYSYNALTVVAPRPLGRRPTRRCPMSPTRATRPPPETN